MTKGTLMFMRLAVLVQLVLGIGFWTGNFTGLVGIHQAVGSLYVVALLILAVIALKNGRAKGLAATSIVWGLVIAGFGTAQIKMMPGDSHWIVRVAHLVISLAAMPMAERLAKEG